MLKDLVKCCKYATTKSCSWGKEALQKSDTFRHSKSIWASQKRLKKTVQNGCRLQWSHIWSHNDHTYLGFGLGLVTVLIDLCLHEESSVTFIFLIGSLIIKCHVVNGEIGCSRNTNGCSFINKSTDVWNRSYVSWTPCIMYMRVMVFRGRDHVILLEFHRANCM